MRGRNAGLSIADTIGIRYRTALKSNTVARCDTRDRVLRAGIQRITDHHTRLGPVVRVLNALDSGGNRAGAVEHLVGKVKFVSRAPDVGA